MSPTASAGWVRPLAEAVAVPLVLFGAPGAGAAAGADAAVFGAAGFAAAGAGFAAAGAGFAAPLAMLLAGLEGIGGATRVQVSPPQRKPSTHPLISRWSASTGVIEEL